MKTVTVARWVSLIAAFIWGAVAEYRLATAVGADQYTAVLLPLVLDVWGFAAMRVGRTWQIAGALATMFGTQMVSHLLTLGQAPGRMVALSIAVSAIPPAVSLACHRLGHEATAVDTVDDSYAARKAERFAEIYTPDAPVDTLEGTRGRFVVNPVPEWTRADDKAADAYVAEVTADDTVDAAPSKAEYAAKGAELIASGLSKTAAAERLGISRQWLHKCMTECAV